MHVTEFERLNARLLAWEALMLEFPNTSSQERELMDVAFRAGAKAGVIVEDARRESEAKRHERT